MRRWGSEIHAHANLVGSPDQVVGGPVDADRHNRRLLVEQVVDRQIALDFAARLIDEIILEIRIPVDGLGPVVLVDAVRQPCRSQELR